MVNVEFKREGLKSLKRLVTCLLVTACLLLAGSKVADASGGVDALMTDLFGLCEYGSEVVDISEDIDVLAFSSTHPPFNNPSTPETPKLISLDFQDADVVPILRLLGRVSERNIVIHPDVKGAITLRLMDVPWQLAMDIILRTFNLKKIIEEDIIRILPLKAFEGEVKAVAAERDAVMAAKDIETRVFRIVHVKAAEAKGIIEGAGILTPRGTITIDERTRSIIIIDVPLAHALAESLVSAIDIPTPQVLIETRMVEVREIYAHAFGVQWGFWAEEGRFDWGGSIVDPLVGIYPVPGGTFVPKVPMIVDLPALEPVGALTIGFLNAAQTLGLDLRISALEAIDKAEMISNPRIMALCGVEASISQGGEITVPLGEGEYTTVEALLELAITPEILIDGTILLDLEVTNDTIVSPIHPIETAIKEAITSVSLRDGETVVIGGILTTLETEREEAVPGISKIPLLGRLFRHEVKEIRTDEMIIFITPRIMR